MKIKTLQRVLQERHQYSCKKNLPPKVRLEHPPGLITEGDTVIFKCLAQSNPDTDKYQWFLGGKEQRLGEDVSVMVLPGVDRRSNGDIVNCRVRNRVGTSEESHTLDIYCE